MKVIQIRRNFYASFFLIQVQEPILKDHAEVDKPIGDDNANLKFRPIMDNDVVQQVQPQLHDDSIKKEQIDHPLVAQQVCMMLPFDIFCLASFLSSPLAGKRDIVVTIFVWCMCVCPCVHPSGFVLTITCTIMHGFQNNLAQLLPLRRRNAI